MQVAIVRIATWTGVSDVEVIHKTAADAPLVGVIKVDATGELRDALCSRQRRERDERADQDQ